MSGIAQWLHGRRRARQVALFREFLEPAREILDSPASPMTQGLGVAIAALVVLVLLILIVCRADIFAEAPGRIEPVGRSKVVQPLDAGRVMRLTVANGSMVEAGQLLVQLDPTEASAAEAAASDQAQALQAEITRRRIELQAVGSGDYNSGRRMPAGDFTKTYRDREQVSLDADLTQLAATVDQLRGKISENVARRTSSEMYARATAGTVRTLNQQLRMAEQLAADGWGSRLVELQTLGNLQKETASLTSIEGDVMAAVAEGQTLQADLRQTVASFAGQDATALRAAEVSLDQTTQQQIKAADMLRHTAIVASISGTVQELAVTTPGQVVSSGQQLMTIVPTTSQLQIEAMVENKDVGFVALDQPVVIKVAAFPFTRYGTITGKVIGISRDAVQSADASSEQGPDIKPELAQADGAAAVPHTQNLVFPVIIQVDRSTMEIDGRQVRLTSGMEVTVDIKTGRRRAISYLLSPLVEVGMDAAHER